MFCVSLKDFPTILHNVLYVTILICDYIQYLGYDFSRLCSVLCQTAYIATVSAIRKCMDFVKILGFPHEY